MLIINSYSFNSLFLINQCKNSKYIHTTVSPIPLLAVRKSSCKSNNSVDVFLQKLNTRLIKKQLQFLVYTALFNWNSMIHLYSILYKYKYIIGLKFTCRSIPTIIRIGYRRFMWDLHDIYRWIKLVQINTS